MSFYTAPFSRFALIALLGVAAPLGCASSSATQEVHMHAASSGTVTMQSSDGLARTPPAEAPPRTLALPQLQALHSWVEEHPAGWRRSHATYVPVVKVRLSHSGGSMTSLIIQDAQVVLESDEGQFVRPLTRAEHDELLAIVGAP